MSWNRKLSVIAVGALLATAVTYLLSKIGF